MFAAVRQALGRPFALPVLRRWCLLSPSMDNVAVMMGSRGMYNVIRAIEQWPLGANQTFCHALAGARATRMASPLRRSNLGRAALEVADFARPRSNSP
eukprot:1232723-Pyramimonas_sp.AAC.1